MIFKFIHPQVWNDGNKLKKIFTSLYFYWDILSNTIGEIEWEITVNCNNQFFGYDFVWVRKKNYKYNTTID